MIFLIPSGLVLYISTFSSLSDVFCNLIVDVYCFVDDVWQVCWAAASLNPLENLPAWREYYLIASTIVYFAAFETNTEFMQ